MANQEHVAKLSEGVEAWNQWRLKNLDIQPDLQEEDLGGAQLQGANLRGAFFDNATNLEEVILGDGKGKFALLADVSWGGANLAAVDWSPLKMLGDEYLARHQQVA